MAEKNPIVGPHFEILWKSIPVTWSVRTNVLKKEVTQSGCWGREQSWTLQVSKLGWAVKLQLMRSRAVRAKAAKVIGTVDRGP